MELPTEGGRMQTEFDPIVNTATIRESELDVLAQLAGEFAALEESDAALDELHHLVLSRVYELCGAVLRCEEAGIPKKTIVGALRRVREIHARSPFVRRLQDWPRGYPGDFETIEQLWSGRNDADEGTIAAVCERYSLDLPIAQQHRNKVHQQAAHILRTICPSPNCAGSG